MRINCPMCNERLITRSSKRPSPALYEVYAQCRNPECGWGGKAHVEFAVTTSPTRLLNPPLRIPLEGKARERLLSQLAEH